MIGTRDEGMPVSAEITMRLLCATCGERIAPGRGRTGFTHVARLVASCDLDGDHPAMPDAAALGMVACRTCGDPVRHDGTGFTHADPARDEGHAPDPELPAF